MISLNSKPGGGRGISWQVREMGCYHDLLLLWGEEKVQQALGCHRNTDAFEKISKQMHSLGHKRSMMECQMKTLSTSW